MCHANLEACILSVVLCASSQVSSQVNLTDGVNFIIGENGSGKVRRRGAPRAGLFLTPHALGSPPS